MKKFTIVIEATTEDDVAFTLEEVLCKVKAGYEKGYDEREDSTASYTFDSTGEYDEMIEEDDDDGDSLEDIKVIHEKD